MIINNFQGELTDISAKKEAMKATPNIVYRIAASYPTSLILDVLQRLLNTHTVEVLLRCPS